MDADDVEVVDDEIVDLCWESGDAIDSGRARGSRRSRQEVTEHGEHVDMVSLVAWTKLEVC